MRERKKPGDEDDYNKTHHVYDDPLRLVQEIQREREEISRRQDSQKVLNIDVKKTKTSPRDGGAWGKKVPPKTKPKSTTNSKLRNNHGNEITTSSPSSSSSFNVSSELPSDVSRLPLNNLSGEPPSASNYTNTGFLSDIQENDHHVAARAEATNVARSPTSTLIQNFESKTTRSEKKDHVSLKQSNVLPDVNRVTHLQQQFDSFKETKSSGQKSTSSTTKDQQHSGGTPDPTLLSSISVEQSTPEGTSEDRPIIVLTHSPTHRKQKQSSKESPYEVLPLRKDPAKINVIAVAPPEPPPPRTDHEKIDGSPANDSSGKGTSKQSDTPPVTLPDGEVELGLGANPTVVTATTFNHASNSSLTSSTAKNIVDMIRRRRKRRFLLLLITFFLFIMLVGVASVAVYLVSLNSPSDEDPLQISDKETENYDSNR